MKTYLPHSSSLGGVSANLVAMGCFLAVLVFRNVGLLAVLILFFAERSSGFVKYHAVQALSLWIVRYAVSFVSNFNSGDGPLSEFFGYDFFLFRVANWGGNLVLGLLDVAVGVAFVVFCIVGAVRAYRWQLWSVPLLGSIADQLYTKGQPVYYDGGPEVPPEARRATDPQPTGGPGPAAPGGYEPPPPQSPPEPPQNHDEEKHHEDI